LLIGIGINVATDLSSGPADARSIGIALADLLPPHAHRPDAAETLLARFLESFPRSLKNLADPDSGWIAEARRYDRLAGTPISARQGEDLIRGLAQGWDEFGRLIVARELGGTALVSSGQILRPSSS
jgi:biotin-(acetyl-CoA carboxylase) ligase